MKLGNVISTLENLQEVEPMDEIAQQQAAQDAVEVQGEIESDYKDIDDVDTGISDAEETVGSIDEVIETVGADPEVELSEGEVATVEALVDSVYKRLGLAREIPSMESIGSLKASNVVATLEDAKEGILSKIASAAKAALDMVIKFLSGLFQNKALLARYIDSVKNKLEANKDKMNPSAGANVKGFNSLKRAMDGLGSAKVSISLCVNAQQALEDVKKLDGETAIALELDTNPKGKIAETFLEFVKLAQYGSDGVAFGLFSGNKGCSAKVPEEGQTMSIDFIEYSGSTDKDSGLSYGDAGKVLKEAKSVLEQFSNMKKFENKLIAVFKMIGSSVSSVYHAARSSSKDVEKATEHNIEAHKKLALTFFRGIATLFGAKLPKEIFANISNVTRYVEACIKASVGTSTQTD